MKEILIFLRKDIDDIRLLIFYDYFAYLSYYKKTWLLFEEKLISVIINHLMEIKVHYKKIEVKFTKIPKKYPWNNVSLFIKSFLKCQFN